MDQIDSFTLNADGDFYERIVPENDLVLSFEPDTDGELAYIFFKKISDIFNNSQLIFLFRYYAQFYTSDNIQWLQNRRQLRCQVSFANNVIVI